MRRIVTAANQHKKTRYKLIGIRHWDKLMRWQLDNYNEAWLVDNCKLKAKDFIQGFIDNKGQFWNRIEALEIAEKAGQIINKKTSPKDQLFSEDLY